MSVHSYDIYRTLEKFLKKSFQPNNKKGLWLHVNANVYIAAFMLLVSCHRAEYAQRLDAENAFQFLAMCLY